MIKKIIIGIFMISLLTGCGCEKKEIETPEEEIKINTNEEVIKDQTVEEFEFKNTSLIYEDGNTTLETAVTNTSDKDAYLKEFKIQALDQEGKIMVVLTGFVGDVIKAGETKVINSYTLEDLTSAEKLVYYVIR